MKTLQAHQVRASYLRKGASTPLEVLRGADFSAQPGEVVAVRGASGAGKSTLLAVLGGMLRPEQGRVTYGGQDIYEWSDVALSGFRGECIGFLFQLDFLLPNYTIAENIGMALHYARRRDHPEEDIARILHRVALSARRDHLPDELSGGERHRAALARAVVHRPSLILADEPTGNLDRANAIQILDLLWQQRDGGAIVLIATHDDWVAAKADRVIALSDGLIREGAS